MFILPLAPLALRIYFSAAPAVQTLPQQLRKAANVVGCRSAAYQFSQNQHRADRAKQEVRYWNNIKTSGYFSVKQSVLTPAQKSKKREKSRRVLPSNVLVENANHLSVCCCFCNTYMYNCDRVWFCNYCWNSAASPLQLLLRSLCSAALKTQGADGWGSMEQGTQRSRSSTHLQPVAFWNKSNIHSPWS